MRYYYIILFIIILFLSDSIKYTQKLYIIKQFHIKPRFYKLILVNFPNQQIKVDHEELFKLFFFLGGG